MSEERDASKSFSAQEFAAELRRLADALEAGKSFEIEIEGEMVAIPMEAVCSVEHERSEDGEEEIEFQLAWNVADNGDEDDDDDDDDDEDEDEAAEDEGGGEAGAGETEKPTKPA